MSATTISITPLLPLASAPSLTEMTSALPAAAADSAAKTAFSNLAEAAEALAAMSRKAQLLGIVLPEQPLASSLTTSAQAMTDRLKPLIEGEYKKMAEFFGPRYGYRSFYYRCEFPEESRCCGLFSSEKRTEILVYVSEIVACMGCFHEEHLKQWEKACLGICQILRENRSRIQSIVVRTHSQYRNEEHFPKFAILQELNLPIEFLPFED